MPATLAWGLVVVIQKIFGAIVGAIAVSAAAGTAPPQQAVAEQTFRVQFDGAPTVELKEWGLRASDEAREWYPRIANLLNSRGFETQRTAKLVILKSDQGLASTSGSTITVHSNWIEKHPEDIGVVVHELVHVVQGYPSGQPWWITEGIADYVRWAIYEGKPQSWFPRPRERDGYKKGYRAAAGFLLWLESDHSPGIVRHLNTAMREQKYSDELFKTRTGHTLPELWHLYLTAPELN